MVEETQFYSHAKPHWLRLLYLFGIGSPFWIMGPTYPFRHRVGLSDPYTLGIILMGSLLLALNFRVTIYRIRLPVTVDASGLQSYTGFGALRHLEWSQMAKVEVHDHLTNYLLVQSESERKVILFIPMFLKDQQGFYDSVCKYAPADNPLRVWIEAIPPPPKVYQSTDWTH